MTALAQMIPAPGASISDLFFATSPSRSAKTPSGKALSQSSTPPRQKKLNRQQVALVSSNIKCVQRIAQSMTRRTSIFSKEDLESIGYEALTRSALRFDSSQGVPFEQFAKIRIQGAMKDEIRRATPGLRSNQRAQRILHDNNRIVDSLASVNNQTKRDAECRILKAQRKVDQAKIQSSFVSTSPKDPDQVNSPKTSPEQRVLNDERHARLESAMEKMTNTEQRFLRDIYYRGKKMSELANEGGKSVSTVSRKHKTLIARFRSHLEKRFG